MRTLLDFCSKYHHVHHASVVLSDIPPKISDNKSVHGLREIDRLFCNVYSRQKMIIITIAVLIFSMCVFSQEPSKNEKIQSAIASTEKWLSIVDSGNYSQSWQEAGQIFQNQVSDSQWTSAVRKVREPLGDLITRTVKKSEYKTSLPGVPDGEYVVVVFQTQYENKKKALETVTTAFEDNQWKVVGYFIR